MSNLADLTDVVRLREAVLTTKARKALDKSQFAIPSKAPGSGSYPIHDLSHAKNALARSSGKPEEATVKAAVYKKWPQLRPNASTRESVTGHMDMDLDGDQPSGMAAKIKSAQSLMG